MASAHIGTSAFAEAAWRGGFYPADLPASRYLAFYASRLNSLEVNSTFYGLPRPDTLAHWSSSVPPRFRFALKAPRYITHQQPLERAEPLQALLRAARALGGLAGPLLFLLPPWLPADRNRLARFLDLLPAGQPVAFEFRQPSWHRPEIAALLAASGAALCGCDAGPAPSEPQPGDRFVYVRLRRGSYAPAEIEAWAGRIRGWMAAGMDVFCYLKHDATGRGPQQALSLAAAAGRDGDDAEHAEHACAAAPARTAVAPDSADVALDSVDAHMERPDADVEGTDAHMERPDADVEGTDAHVERPDTDVERADAHVERPDADVKRTDAAATVPAPAGRAGGRIAPLRFPP